MSEFSDRNIIVEDNLGDGLKLDPVSNKVNITLKDDEKVLSVDENGISSSLDINYDADSKELEIIGKDGEQISSTGLDSLANDADVQNLDIIKRDKTDRVVYETKNEQWKWTSNSPNLPSDFLTLANSTNAPKPKYHVDAGGGGNWANVVFFNLDGSIRYICFVSHDSQYTGKETQLHFRMSNEAEQEFFDVTASRDDADDDTIVETEDFLAYKSDLYAVTNQTKQDLATKVDKVSGKGLSSNDYTTAEKTKLSNIASGAQVNVIEKITVNDTEVTPSNKTINIKIVDAYTKSETDNLLNDKENSGTASNLINNINKSDTAVAAQLVSAVSQSKGVISVTRRALVAADIPTLAISKISNLQTTLNGKTDKFTTTDKANLTTDDGVVEAIKKILIKMAMSESNIEYPNI